MTPFSAISSPQDLKKLSLEEMQILAIELRQRILSTCLKNGGHLGASLGTVELAIALHTVFDSPREPIVWDVGHQAYAHKLLTGRWESFEKLRLTGGMSGFLSRAESPHDPFGAGHSSTSISAAISMAWARGRENLGPEVPWTVAVIGDGGLTAGLSFEALNNASISSLGPLLVVLNDNQMSISPNAGALSEILSGPQAKTYFELFGFDYVGPLDGHDLATLLGMLQGLHGNYAGRPILLHVITQKGKGYIPAEERPDIYHGISPVKEKIPGAAASPSQRTYSDAFGAALCQLAEKDPKVVAITAAMTEGTGLSEFAKKFPDRFFDVGIAEPHAVTFAAGLATQGYKPVVAIYSTFLQRGIDGLIHDVALQGLGVTFAVDRAGLVGADGPTHHGMFDLAYFGMVPGVQIWAPASYQALDEQLSLAVNSGCPAVVRYPRGFGPEISTASEKDGIFWLATPHAPQAAVFAVGPAVWRAQEAALALAPAQIAVCGVQKVKPLPKEVMEWCLNHPTVPILVVEDGIQQGGFGQKLLTELNLLGRHSPAILAAYGDHWVGHGALNILEEGEGLSTGALVKCLKKWILP